MTEELRNPDADDVTLVTLAFAKSTTLLESIKFKLRKLDWVEDRTDKALHLVAGLNDKMIELRFGVDKRFDAVERRLDRFQEDVDQRFEAVDKRFEAVNKRFDAVDQRFDAVDQRFDGVDKRLEEMNHRFGTIEVLLRELVGKPA